MRIFLVQTICQGGRSRLVDNALDFKTGYFSGLLGSLALGIVEVGGNSNDGSINFGTQVRLGVGFHGLQSFGRNFLGRINLAIYFHTSHIIFAGHNLVGNHTYRAFDLRVGEFAAHETLDGINGVFGI